jgi:hypothetical protein
VVKPLLSTLELGYGESKQITTNLAFLNKILFFLSLRLQKANDYYALLLAQPIFYTIFPRIAYTISFLNRQIRIAFLGLKAPFMLFMSYSRRELYFAEFITLHLQSEGVSVWFDIQQLEPGVNWKLDIEEGLQSCKGLILLASESALASPYVALEWQRALRDKKPIYLALFEAVQLPDVLRANAILLDFRQDSVAGLADLLAAIGGAEANPVSEPEAKLYPARYKEAQQELLKRPFLIFARLGLISFILASIFIQDFLILLFLFSGFWGMLIIIFFYIAFGDYRRLLSRQFPHTQDNELDDLLTKPLNAPQRVAWIEQNRELALRSSNHEMPSKIRIGMYWSMLQARTTLNVYDEKEKHPFIMPEIEAKIPYQLYCADSEQELRKEIGTILEIAGFEETKDETGVQYHVLLLTESLTRYSIQKLFGDTQNTIAILCDNKDYLALEPRIAERQIVDFRLRNRGMLATYFAFLHKDDDVFRMVLSLNIVPANLNIKLFAPVEGSDAPTAGASSMGF